MEKAIQISKLCLAITCSWPCEKRPFWQKIFAISWLFIATIFTLFMYMEAGICLRKNDLVKICTIMHWPILLTSYLAKYLNFVYRGNDVVQLQKLLNEKLFYDHPAKLNHHLVNAVKHSNILGMCYMTMVFTYVTISTFSPLIFEDKNLPWPISIDFGNYLPLMYAMQVIGLIHAALANGALDILFVSMILLGCSQFDILNDKILDVCNKQEEIANDSIIINDDIDRKLIRNLANLVKHHHLIIKFFEYQERMFSFGLLVQFLGSVASLSCLGFLLFLVPPNTNDTYITIFMFVLVTSEIFLYCFFGDMVMVKSTQIANACYFCDWYKCNPVIIKSLIIIMQRSARPLTITLMKFAPFSLELFKNVLRTSYSYFALLIRLANKNE